MFCVTDALGRPCPPREISLCLQPVTSLYGSSHHVLCFHGFREPCRGKFAFLGSCAVVASASWNKTKPSCLSSRYKAQQEVLIVHRPILFWALDAFLAGDVLALGRDLLPGEALWRAQGDCDTRLFTLPIPGLT